VRRAAQAKNALQPYLRRPNPAWPDLIDAADWLRHDLGVSKSEPEHFRTSLGGYFHGRIDKAKAGKLHLERTVWALRRATDPERHAGRGGGRNRRDGARAW
jgi:hypothetical protein